MITTAQIAVMGANPDNADVPFTAPEKPWKPWHSPVMILAGSDGEGNPWLYLAARCGWFLGYDSQHSPAVPETYGSERALRDVGRTLLDLLDKIAPKGADDDR